MIEEKSVMKVIAETNAETPKHDAEEIAETPKHVNLGKGWKAFQKKMPRCFKGAKRLVLHRSKRQTISFNHSCQEVLEQI